jgi:hypothetical protein
VFETVKVVLVIPGRTETFDKLKANGKNPCVVTYTLVFVEIAPNPFDSLVVKTIFPPLTVALVTYKRGCPAAVTLKTPGPLLDEGTVVVFAMTTLVVVVPPDGRDTNVFESRIV